MVTSIALTYTAHFLQGDVPSQILKDLTYLKPDLGKKRAWYFTSNVNKTKLRGFSPRANHTDRAAAASRRG